ncbi:MULTISPECIES: trypco2 family protein [unclassified Streptomyces]|uniref:trypco2 family protein n=1 Tax=unclassified Streptomyces TaxID=2593676 RepID=UPI0033DABEB7
MSESIGVGEAVQALRDELLSAATAGAASDVQFEVGPIELEFAVTLTREATARVGLGRVLSAVVSAGASGKVAKEDVHHVKLVLTPRDRTGNPLLISNDAPPETGSLDSSYGR